MIGSVFFDDFIEQYPDQTEAATDKRNQNARIHDISPRSEAEEYKREEQNRSFLRRMCNLRPHKFYLGR